MDRVRLEVSYKPNVESPSVAEVKGLLQGTLWRELPLEEPLIRIVDQGGALRSLIINELKELESATTARLTSRLLLDYGISAHSELLQQLWQLYLEKKIRMSPTGWKLP